MVGGHRGVEAEHVGSQPTFFAVLLAILVSEFGSNLAAVGVVVPIVISICHGSGIDPVLPALAVTLTGRLFGVV